MTDEILEEMGISDKPVILTSARDVKIYEHLSNEIELIAFLQGIITRVHNLGKIIFYDVFDGTDTIQIIANRQDFSEKDWKSLSAIKISSRISVRGRIGHSNKGAISLFLKELPTQEVDLLVISPSIVQNEVVSGQIFLAQLREQARNFFHLEERFLEIEPQLISTSWKNGGIQPLRIDYPGFGVFEYLAPSPAPQLLKAIIVTGWNRVFCISRCFTFTYRDSIVGAESPILSAKKLMGTLDEMIDLSKRAVIEILKRSIADPKQRSFFDNDWLVKQCDWPPIPAKLEIDRPEIQRFNQIESNNQRMKARKIAIFRICWPPNLVLVEGFSELLGGSIPLGSVTIHFERMVKLLSPVELRRIRNLNEIKLQFQEKGISL